MNNIAIKIDNLELFDTVKTYLFINLSTNIKDYNLELFSNDNKLILNNNIENNTLSVNNIVTIEIQPFIQYFLKINYRKINDENTILSWHKFISDKPEDDIKMIIHKKNNNNNNNNFVENHFFENNLSNFFFDTHEESENIDSEDSNDMDNNLSFLSNYIHCDDVISTEVNNEKKTLNRSLNGSLGDEENNNESNDDESNECNDDESNESNDDESNNDENNDDGNNDDESKGNNIL